MVAKNEGGMYVFGVSGDVTVVEGCSNPEHEPIVYLTSLDGNQCISLGVNSAIDMIKFLSRFVEMAQGGELSTKVKPPEMTVTKEVVGEEITDSFLDEEKKDEGHGQVSEGLEDNSRAYKKSE